MSGSNDNDCPVCEPSVDIADGELCPKHFRMAVDEGIIYENGNRTVEICPKCGKNGSPAYHGPHWFPCALHMAAEEKLAQEKAAQEKAAKGKPLCPVCGSWSCIHLDITPSIGVTPVEAAFKQHMTGRMYGEEETADARHHFMAGYEFGKAEEKKS